jgi:hypothetical protein
MIKSMKGNIKKIGNVRIVLLALFILVVGVFAAYFVGYAIGGFIK